MGRVARYKKVRSIDPFAKNGSWKSDVGDCSTIRRVKRKSKTAIRLKEQKLNKFQRRGNKKQNDSAANSGRKKNGGSNGWGDDSGYDLPPEHEDEFNLQDLLGSVKKQRHTSNPLLETNGIAHQSISKPSSSGDGDEKWTRKVGRVDVRGVISSAPSNNSSEKHAQPTKKKNCTKGGKSNTKNDGTKITAKTSTREIIEACSNPNNKRKINDNNTAESTGTSKQEKRKAFFEKKKSKKRNKRSKALDDDDEDDEYYANQQALQSLHSQSSASQQSKQANSKKHTIKQENYSDTMIARSSMNDQVERPPTFTTLPRGANKLSKNKKKTGDDNTLLLDEDDKSKAQRIRKEQQALEAMRERVMKQYAMLRESRRNGSGGGGHR